MQQNDNDADMASMEGEAIRSLQKHIEDMRNLTLCKICLKPFYEPFILGCGHTYCYSCLRSWFAGGIGRTKNKNCPDCRTVVSVIPAPNYLLRDLTHLFVGRTELLPEDETVQEHARDKEEEANLLIKDRKEKKLFQGVFNRMSHPFLAHIPTSRAPIHDVEDGVLRCPFCTHEIEDGICSNCGLPFEDEDVDVSDLNDDDSIDSDSDNLTIEGEVVPTRGFSFFHGPEIDVDESEDNEDDWDGSELDHYDEHDDFIDNENEDDADGMEAGGDYDTYPTDAATPYSDGNSQAGTNYDTEEEIRGDAQRFQAAIRNNVVLDSDDEIPPNIWSSDGGNQSRPRTVHRHPPPTRNRRPIVISDEEEWTQDDDDDDDEVLVRTGRPARPNFRAPELSSDDDDDDGESDNDSSTNLGSISSGSSGSQSSSSSSEDDNESQDQENDSEDSDDTAIPPQSGRDRRQRLQGHRSRRSQPGTTRITIDVASPPPPPARNYGRPSRNGVRSGRRGRLAVY